MKNHRTEDILPELLTLTGLTQAQLDKALEELDRKGFIALDKTGEDTLITLRELEWVSN